jgi:hypothetical protein
MARSEVIIFFFKKKCHNELVKISYAEFKLLGNSNLLQSLYRRVYSTSHFGFKTEN